MWKIWTSPNWADVYIALRELGPYQKWSLHKPRESGGPGEWLYQWVKSERAEKRAKELGNTQGRVLDKWQQPAELAGSGWTSAFSIRIRHQDLAEYDDSQLPDDICWVPAPPEGTERQLHIAILRPRATETVFEMTEMVPLCGFGLVDGRYVLVLGSTHPIPDETNAKINGWIDAGLRAAPEGVVQKAESPRMAVHAIMDDGHRVAWDLAIPPETLKPDQASTD